MLENNLGILLLNKKVLRIENIHDYLQLQFDGGDIVNIFNRYRLMSRVAGDLSQLIGTLVVEHRTTTSSECLRFSNETTLEVGMKDSDYRGPEAIEVITEDGARIVWS